MTVPSSALSTLRPDLAAFFEFDLEAEQQGFIGTRVLPVVEVGLQSDNPGKMPLEQLLAEATTSRTSGSVYNRGSWKFETFSYATKENGFEEPIDERDEKRYRHIIDAERIAASRAMATVLRNQEKRIADLVFNATTWNGASLTTAITNEWDSNHTTNATPIADVENAVRKVYDNSGLWCNALIINRKVFRNLRALDDITDRVASAGAGDATKASDITAEMLAMVFDLDYVIVAGSSKNTAKEGQSATPGQIWSDEYAMVAKICVSGDMREPGIGRTFQWSEDGSLIGGTMEEYYEVQSRSRIIRVRHETDEVIMYPQAGHLLSNVTTI
jgi:hypothetical protein